jgi:hypothetical protein
MGERERKQEEERLRKERDAGKISREQHREAVRKIERDREKKDKER